MNGKKILILGVTGMLGHTLFHRLSKNDAYVVFATARSSDGLSKWFSPELVGKIYSGVDGFNFHTMLRVLESIRPDIVINCIGLIKQIPSAGDPLPAITINAQLPHQISSACKTVGARMIHVSTDCVFDGMKGRYTENDRSNATDLYGRTKYLGEVVYPHCITLRTSIIGHELKSKLGLLEWVLSQEKKVQGYTHAIYSGFPTIEFAHIIDTYVIPSDGLSGLYHVSSQPISKYELLKLILKKYNRPIEIEPFDDIRSDRSLDSSVFRTITGYSPPSWAELVDTMHQNFISSDYYGRNKKNEASHVTL